MIWVFTAAGTLGLAAVALVQIAICKAASALLFRSDTTRKDFWTEFGRGSVAGLTSEQLMRRAELAGSWQNHVFNLFLTFVAAGLGEEILKCLPIIYARRRGTAQDRQRRNRAYLDYAIAGALGFGLVETIGFIHVACETGGESWPRLMLTLFERVSGQFGHLSMAALTAIRAIRRDYYGDRLSWWDVLRPAILFHGTFNFVAMTGSALEGNVGWIHPVGLVNATLVIGLATGLVARSAWQVRQEWEALKIRDHLAKSTADDSAKN